MTHHIVTPSLYFAYQFYPAWQPSDLRYILLFPPALCLLEFIVSWKISLFLTIIEVREVVLTEILGVALFQVSLKMIFSNKCETPR